MALTCTVLARSTDGPDDSVALATTNTANTANSRPQPVQQTSPPPSQDRPSSEPSGQQQSSQSSQSSAEQAKPKSLGALVRGGLVAAAVYDRSTDQFVYQENSTRRFESASLVKLLIALDALNRASGDDGRVARMLSYSDDDIASELWSDNGGPSIVTRWATKIGLTGTRPPADPNQWGDTTTTAEDVVAIYRYLLGTASHGTRDVIVKALSGAASSGADGFDQTFGIPDAVGAIPWAIKQGWACCSPDRVLHSTGLLGKDERYILVVLTSRPQSLGWADSRAQVTRIVESLVPLVSS
ncbi:serine hydrolase [Solihabitans fulvus]|uniref:Serine hydrolase n=2 Tax=Solihabitans fulvus TaxID=1892852 RepID=A0A5B2WN07_9PSEU|nr:serine hydrolase [Solihabitans fulvus]